jgi:ubiquinol-cytochrome c reductase cytochrome c1 subunit
MSHGQEVQVFSGWKQVTPGTLSARDYDSAMADLVSYLQWMAEPAQNTRVRVGAWVLLFLGLFVLVAWRLNAAYWKEIK